jgi:hypothetical protein
MMKFFRRVIRIRAEDSPNVRYGLAQEAAGLKPTNRRILPGVLSFEEYKHRKATWDLVRQCVGLDGEFYAGVTNLMFPPEFLNAAEHAGDLLQNLRRGTERFIGVDTAEGGDDTCWTIIDRKGMLFAQWEKTPNTAVIPNKTIALMEEWKVPADNVMFDQGGGGQEHADQLRERGHWVRTVSFGEAAGAEPIPYRVDWDNKQARGERTAVYKNRRAEMYHMIRLVITPRDEEPDALVFGIPAKYIELRRQLAPIPLDYDQEGKITLPPKRKRDASDTRLTLFDILGRSPDQADALACAVYCMMTTSAVSYAPLF